jgi:uridylate kinase
VLPVGPNTKARRSESEHAMAKPIYRRVIVKISGEALAGSQDDASGGFGIHEATLERVAADLVATRALGVTLGVVVGGGNFMRGANASQKGLPRVTGDMMGMLATVMNALALEAAIEALKVPARAMSALAMPAICETYERRRAARHLEEGRVLLLAAGTGNPFFTTDTTAVLRAAELGAQAVLKATDVDGIYSADPKKDPRAERYDRLTHDEALARDLKVMDATAFALARENRMPIIVFSIRDKGAIQTALQGEGRSTVVGT